MKEIKSRTIYNLALVILLIGLLLVSSLATMVPLLAAPAETVALNVTQDSYTDLNFATTNFDEDLLTAANSPGAPGDPDVSTKYTYLEFDLSGMDFEIKSASLSLSTLTCDGLVPVDDVEITVYGVDNAADWSESTLTWDNQPAISTSALVSLDADSIMADFAETYTWTDANQGDLSAWLNTQRQANDGSVTLVLAIENAADPGIANVFFEDSEGSGAVYGCSDALGQPMLTVSSSVIWSSQIFLPFVGR